MNKFENEQKALEVFCSAFEYDKTTFQDIKETECPDIQTINDDIGIEVTKVIAQTDAELEFLFNKTRKFDKQCLEQYVQKNTEMADHIKAQDIIVRNGIVNAMFYSVNDNKTPITDAIDKKLQKLQEYKLFKTNILFLIIQNQVLDTNFIKNTIVEEIKSIERNYSTVYDLYLLFDRLREELFVIDSDYNVKSLLLS